MWAEGWDFKRLLSLAPDQGLVSFSGSRRLILQADALGELRREMISTLGEEIARGVLTRFGYQCGCNDAETLRGVFPGKEDWLLGGPMMHTNQGVVHVQNQVLRFDERDRLVVMKGIWRHSYEAEQHLRMYGEASNPACWTLVGYASGYASVVVGHPAMAVETRCHACGDATCGYEIRPMEDWDAERAALWRYYQPNAAVKSLERMLAEEREHTAQHQLLSEVTLQMTAVRDPRDLAERVLTAARELVGGAASLRVAVDPEGRCAARETVGEPVNESLVNEVLDLVPGLLNLGKVFNFEAGAHPLLGVPLVVLGRSIGALVVVGRRGSSFSETHHELLGLLGSQAAATLENLRLYERIEKELEITVGKLSRANKMLNAQNQALEELVQIRKRLTELVLHGKGLPAIARTLSRLVSGSVTIFNERRMVLAQHGPAEGAASTLSAYLADSGKDSSQAGALVRPVMAGNLHLGYVVAIEREKPFSDLESLAVEQAVTVVALELLKGVESRVRIRTDFFDQLLSGKFESVEALHSRAAEFDFNLGLSYRVAVLDIKDWTKGPGGREDLFQAIRRQVLSVSVRSVVATKDGSIVLVLCTNEGGAERTDQVGRAVSEGVRSVAEGVVDLVGRFDPEASAWIGIGRPCSEVADFRRSYDEARKSVAILKRLKLEQRVAFYDQLGLFAVLFDIDPERLAEFQNRVLGKLIDFDAKYKASLVPTLRAYAANNFNLLQTARGEFLSPSTVKYRLKKIAEVADLDLDDPDTRLNLQLAIKLVT